MRFHYRWIFSLSCVLIAVSSVFGGDWPAWRGPRHDGISSDAKVAVSWSATKGMRWKVPLPSNNASSPIAVGEKVIVTVMSGYENRELAVICFDQRTGKQLWQRSMSGHARPALDQIAPANEHVIPSPVSDGSLVVVLFMTGDLAAFSIDGEPLWFRSLQEEYGEFSDQNGLVASPVISGTVAILQIGQTSSGYLLAVDTESGETEWKSELKDTIDNSAMPLIVERSGKTAVICAGSKQLSAFDLTDGKVMWVTSDLGRLCCSSPVHVGDRLLISSGPDGNLQSLRIGKDLSEVPKKEWQSAKGTRFTPVGVCVGKNYFYSSNGGIINCLDVATGADVWTHQLAGAFPGPPVTAAGRIYFTNTSGTTTILDATAKYREVGICTLGEAITVSPAISNNCLIFAAKGHLMCIQPKP
jgi:outer membrane protein assembly factor BamB